jgi:hypothetical protein
MSAIVPATSIAPVEPKHPPMARATITACTFGALSIPYRKIDMLQRDKLTKLSSLQTVQT